MKAKLILVIGLLFSLFINGQENNCVEKENDLSKFKSTYEFVFQKNRSLSTNVLNIEILNLRINEFEASVEVSKVIGISMIYNRFYFNAFMVLSGVVNRAEYFELSGMSNVHFAPALANALNSKGTFTAKASAPLSAIVQS